MRKQPGTSGGPRRRKSQLGRVEVAILECLRFEGQWKNADDIAMGVYIRVGAGPVPYPCPLTLFVSIRRAINALARKRMLKVGFPTRHLTRDPMRRLACWLPEHAAPELIVPTGRDSFRREIIDILSQIGPAEAEAERKFHKPPAGIGPRYDLSQSDVPYGSVVGKILKKLGSRRVDENRFQVAIFRATMSLLRDGSIEGLVLWTDKSMTTRRFAYVRLKDVAM